MTELDSNNICAEQCEKIHVLLKKHQLTLLNRCQELEQDKYYYNANDYISTNIGIIGDKVGSGKSYVILSLCCKPLAKCEDIAYTSYGLDLLMRFKQRRRNIIPTSVIVIPHSICTQWMGYVKNTSLSYIFMNKSKHIENLTSNKCNFVDVIFVTNTMHNIFCSKCAELDICFSRVFYDEADNLKINACDQLNAQFYWLITASLDNLKYPNGIQQYNETLRRYFYLANGIKTRGFIKEFCNSLVKTPFMFKVITAKNKDTFVDESLSLPQPIVNKIKCKTPYYINILHNVADYNIIRCLNAHDYKGALSYINPNQKGSEENIVNLLLEKYNNNVHNLNIRINYVNNVIYDNPAEKDRIVYGLNAELTKLNNKIDNIKQRIKDNAQCPICYEVCINKTIVKCCQNSFCFNCVSSWLQTNKHCPLCKSNQTLSNILIVDESTDAKQNEEELLKSKLEAAIDIVSNDVCNKRIIIMAQYEGILMSIEKELLNLDIKYGYLKGHQATIDRLINQFNNSEINVLLVNPTFYGSGMNLEKTTDIIMFHKFNDEIEKQVIGRAQRLGRTSSLSLWYLLYENEHF